MDVLLRQAFSQDIGDWAVRSVTDMSSMFGMASSFNQDIGGWVVHSVSDMGWMFAGAASFNRTSLAGRSTASRMESMFNGASAFYQNLGWCLDEDVDLRGALRTDTRASATSCGVCKWTVADARADDDARSDNVSAHSLAHTISTAVARELPDATSAE